MHTYHGACVVELQKHPVSESFMLYSLFGSRLIKQKSIYLLQNIVHILEASYFSFDIIFFLKEIKTSTHTNYTFSRKIYLFCVVMCIQLLFLNLLIGDKINFRLYIS